MVDKFRVMSGAWWSDATFPYLTMGSPPEICHQLSLCYHDMIEPHSPYLFHLTFRPMVKEILTDLRGEQHMTLSHIQLSKSTIPMPICTHT